MIGAGLRGAGYEIDDEAVASMGAEGGVFRRFVARPSGDNVHGSKKRRGSGALDEQPKGA
jgi:hypothetical protein